jgi:hypothetical protein
MIQFIKRNAIEISVIVLTAITVCMLAAFVVYVAQSPRSERPVTEISDTKMPEPGPGIGMNGKFNPNFLGTAPGL